MMFAFIWSYAPCQLPTGLMLDRWGTRKTAARCIALWSAAAALTGTATSFPAVFFTRLLLGIGESPTFPLAGVLLVIGAVVTLTMTHRPVGAHLAPSAAAA